MHDARNGVEDDLSEGSLLTTSDAGDMVRMEDESPFFPLAFLYFYANIGPISPLGAF